ncbi:hypothetical protein Tco_0946120, partial [Tanacetum coccineum]
MTIGDHFSWGTTRGIIDEGTEGPINLGPERPRVYSELSQEEKDRVDRTEDRVTVHGEQEQLVMGEHRTEWGMLIRVKPGRTPNTNGVILDEEQSLFLAGGLDNAIDEDVDEQPVQDLALNVDNVFQADDCDAYDSDVDDAPTAQTLFMANLSSADPVYDSDVLSEVQAHDHYQDVVCDHHEEHE